LLSTYSLALKGGKMWVGFLAVLYVVLIMIVGTYVYARFADWGLVGRAAPSVVALGQMGDGAQPAAAPAEEAAEPAPEAAEPEAAVAEEPEQEAEADDDPLFEEDREEAEDEGAEEPADVEEPAEEAPVAAGAPTEPDGPQSVLDWLFAGRGLKMLAGFLPLLNPFHTGGLGHFLLSALTLLALFWGLGGRGGIIGRLTALEYARDEFPVLSDAASMVRSRRLDYFLTPVWPLLFVLVPVVVIALIGLVCSIPGFGRILMVPLYPVAVLFGVVSCLFAVGGILSFGLMMPAVSVGGKDSFDSWTTAYTYVLWQFGRFVCYTLLAGAVGLIGAVLAYWAVELLIYIIYAGMNIGFSSSVPWLTFRMGGALQVVPVGQAPVAGAMGYIVAVMTLALRAIPVAYVVSFFFTANTLIFFLLRKHVDNIEIEDIYEEDEEEEAPALEEAETPEGEAPEAEKEPQEEPEPEEETEGAEAEEEAPEPEPEQAEEPEKGQ